MSTAQEDRSPRAPRSPARTLALITTLLATALAGCMGEAPPTAPAASGPETTAPAAEEPMSPTVKVEEGAPRLAAAADETWHFTAEPGLSREVPEAGRVSVGMAPQDLVLGMTTVEFLSEPLAEPMLVHSSPVALLLHFESATPLVSNGLFDVAVWGGSDRAMPLFGFTTHAPAAGPGMHTVDITLEFGDQRGIVVSAGERLRYLVVYGFQQPREAGTVQLLVGGEHPSQLTLSASRYSVDPFAGAVPGPDAAFTGEVANGFVPTNCDLAPGVTSLEHEVKVPEGTAWLALEMKATATTAPTADLDFDLYHSGTRVAGSHTPGDKEGILLGAETLVGLAGETLTLKVSTCGTGRMGYEVKVRHATWPTPETAQA